MPDDITAAEPTANPSAAANAPAAEPASPATSSGDDAGTDAAGGASPLPEPKPAASLLGEAKAETDETKTEGEAKTDEIKAAEVKTDAQAAAQDVTKDTEPPAPEPVVNYEFKFPENFTPSEKDVSEFTDLLREHKASPELGQRLVDFYADEVQRIEQAQRETWDRTQTEWQDQVRKDPDLGGDKFDTVMRNCGRVMDEFGTQALREVLTATGAGNHPEVIRFVNKIAAAIGEGKPVLGNPKPAGPPPSRAERRYGRRGAG